MSGDGGAVGWVGLAVSLIFIAVAIDAFRVRYFG